FPTIGIFKATAPTPSKKTFSSQRPPHTTMASAAKQSKKLRILVMPFFATSHILPLTDLAFHLAAVRPDDVEVVVAVTPANAPIVRSALARREPSHASVDV